VPLSQASLLVPTLSSPVNSIQLLPGKGREAIAHCLRCSRVGEGKRGYCSRSPSPAAPCRDCATVGGRALVPVHHPHGVGAHSRGRRHRAPERTPHHRSPSWPSSPSTLAALPPSPFHRSQSTEMTRELEDR
jgi:hypothetical protein